MSEEDVDNLEAENDYDDDEEALCDESTCVGSSESELSEYSDEDSESDLPRVPNDNESSEIKYGKRSLATRKSSRTAAKKFKKYSKLSKKSKSKKTLYLSDSDSGDCNQTQPGTDNTNLPFISRTRPNIDDLESHLNYYLRDCLNCNGYKSPTQQEAVLEIAKRESDVFISMPEVSDRHLCFQLPALCHDGVSIVISNSTSSMKDQVEKLKACHLKAELLYSNIDDEDTRRKIIRDLKSEKPRVKLLYITSSYVIESFYRETITELYKKDLINYLVIDEVQRHVLIILNLLPKCIPLKRLAYKYMRFFIQFAYKYDKKCD